MGRKIFISYKYGDINVSALNGKNYTKVRDYVDRIQEQIDDGDHINKGEEDGEDMGTLEDSTIGSKLGDKIFDSSVTIVLISKNMREVYTLEKDQWMPWEISYSLKEQTREGGGSKTNAILAVVIPDLLGSYSYFIEDNTCPYCKCRSLNTNFLFKILKENMFNIKKPEFTECNNHIGNKPYSGHSSYIHSVKWEDFIGDINNQIEIAVKIKENINDYYLVKTIK